MRDRLRELVDVLQERLNVAKCHRPMRNGDSAGDRNENIADVFDQVHKRHDQSGDELGFPGSLIIAFVFFLKLLDHVVFFIKRLQNRVSGIVFFNLVV